MNQGQSGHSAGHGTGTGVAGPGATDQSMSGGTGVQGMGAGHGSSIPPSAALGASGHKHGAGGNLTGKVEHAVGSMVGSNALKAKGLQKQQLVLYSSPRVHRSLTKLQWSREADAIQVQSSELAEAERLEHEAQMRRDRAVAHGIHIFQPADSSTYLDT